MKLQKKNLESKSTIERTQQSPHANNVCHFTTALSLCTSRARTHTHTQSHQIATQTLFAANNYNKNAKIRLNFPQFSWPQVSLIHAQFRTQTPFVWHPFTLPIHIPLFIDLSICCAARCLSQHTHTNHRRRRRNNYNENSTRTPSGKGSRSSSSFITSRRH